MFTVLFVCTGNICRSPAAAALLRRAVDSTVTVYSAGTHGLRAQPVHPPMARLLTADGIDTSGFRSHRLTASDVNDADLVVTLTAAHRAQVLDVVPTALRRTLSLGELARLASAVPAGTVTGATDAERFGALVRAALGQRHRFLGADDADDVVDPYGHGDDVYATSYAQLKVHVDRLLTVLRA